jgi:hypothetical protein
LSAALSRWCDATFGEPARVLAEALTRARCDTAASGQQRVTPLLRLAARRSAAERTAHTLQDLARDLRG